MRAGRKQPDLLNESHVVPASPVFEDLSVRIAPDVDAEADSGKRRDRLTTAEREETTALRKECAELRRANEILKAASAYSSRPRSAQRPRR